MERKKAISELTVNTQRITRNRNHNKIRNHKKLCQFKVKKKFYLCTLFHFISENEIIHTLMSFIETRQLGLEQESAKYRNATKKGKLPLGALNKFLKTQASEIAP